jgi:hypothetical protein
LNESISKAGKEQIISMLVVLEVRFQVAVDFKQGNKMNSALVNRTLFILMEKLKALTASLEKESMLGLQDLQAVRTSTSFRAFSASNDSGEGIDSIYSLLLTIYRVL